MKVIQNAELYTPEYAGKKDILIEGEKVVRIADSIHEYDGIDEVEKINVNGRIVVPGYIDLHEHITGGGGEGGPTTRVPEASLSTIVRSGVTTVVGLLGTDGITRSLENLLSKTKSLNELGITCFCLTGSYGIPTVTLFDSVEKDILVVDQMIGVKTAMSDHRSSNITSDELIRLASSARRGGLLANKAGYVTIHMGSGKAKLQPLFDAIENSDIPITKFLPTHVTRTEELFRQALQFTQLGGTIDVTAGENESENTEIAKKLKAVYESQGLSNITVSSDGYGSIPKFDEQGNLVGLTYSTPATLHQLLQILVHTCQIPLQDALQPFTKNPAKVIMREDKGCLRAGSDADLIIYDDKMNIETVLARGTYAMKDCQVLMKGLFE